MEIIYKPLSYEYLDSLTELDKKCFKLCWSKKLFEDELNSNIAHYVIALSNNVVIGYAGLQNIVGEGNITNVAVHPDYRRNGVATRLMQEVMNIARECDLEFVTLEVRKSNDSAIALYKKFGFECVGERKGYYSDNHENAILMTKYRPY